MTEPRSQQSDWTHIPSVRETDIGHGLAAFHGVCSCEAWMGPLRQTREEAEGDASAHAEEANDA